MTFQDLTPMTPMTVMYQVDGNDLLVFVNDQWDLFAKENDGVHLDGLSISRKSIWEFIHDPETRLLHAALLEKVRSGTVLRTLPFRCDSPALRRFMEMDISTVGDGRVEYRCRILKTEARDPVPLIADNARADGPFLKMCGWCKKIDTGKHGWAEIEDGIRILGLFSANGMPRISHTICEICMNKVESET